MPKHVCALCGQIVFTTYHEYESHRALYHGLKSAVRPENVTGRTPTQIVAEAEAGWLGPHLITIDGPLTVTTSSEGQHLAACRCVECFNRKLDALIASQEAALQGVSHAETI